MSERRAPLPALSWDEEQALLGVGVKIQRRPSLHLRHAGALAAHAAALGDAARGASVTGVVEERLARLRRRLWRSPFWRDRLRSIGAAPDDLRTLDDLGEVPPLDRDEYARSWGAMFDRDGDPELHVATSSGSTGAALLVPRSGYDGLHTWAVIRFFVDHLGIALPPRPRLVLLCALPGGLEYSVRAPQFERGALHRVSTVRPRPLARLRRARPAILSSDPAGLHWLVGRAAAGDELPRPLLALSSAQHLAPSLRADAERALGTSIVNYYAATETGPIAWECRVEPGRFHLLHPDVWVESIAGALAVTRLRDSPLPIVRYLLGDRGEILDGACACGVRGRSIVGFGGRHPCELVTPDGARVDAWALSWLFKDLPLVRFELAQIGAQRFALTLDPHAELAPELLAERLVRALARMGFADAEVSVERAARPLPRKPSPFVRRFTL